MEARCNARPGVAEGTANIVDTKLTLSLGGTDIDLVELPASPPPNTHVLTNLDVVLNVVLDALRVDINNTLDGALAPLSAIIDPIQDQIVNNLIAQIAPQLAPLEDNILDITLNEQSTPEKGSITVTALHLELLPAAAQFADGALLDIKIGNVGCGPNARVDTPDEPDNPDNPDNPDLPDGPNNPDLPEVPTIVDSGLAGTSTDGGPGSPLLWGILGATVVATAGAGSVTGRRLVRR